MVSAHHYSRSPIDHASRGVALVPRGGVRLAAVARTLEGAQRIRGSGHCASFQDDPRGGVSLSRLLGVPRYGGRHRPRRDHHLSGRAVDAGDTEITCWRGAQVGRCTSNPC